MRVLMFSVDYVPDPGGIAAHVHYLSRALASLGVDVTVVGGHRSPGPPQGDLLPHLDVRSLRRTGPRGLRTVRFILEARKTLRNLAPEGWDIIHFHNFFPDGFLLGRKEHSPAGVRLFTNHSSAFLRHMHSAVWTAWYSSMIRSVDGVIAPSRELEAESRRVVRDDRPVRFIPNGVDENLFTPDPSRRAGDGAQTEIVAVRRLDPKCGIHHLVTAMPLVRAEHPGVRLTVVGDGPERERLERMTADLGIAEIVRFVGSKLHSELPSLYRGAYLSVLPSEYEAVSLSGLESMACGTPVIGSDVGGIPEFLIDGRTGFLVPPADPQSLASAIAKLMSDQALRDEMAANAHSLVMERFRWSIVARSTLDFYEALVERGHGR